MNYLFMNIKATAFNNLKSVSNMGYMQKTLF